MKRFLALLLGALMVLSLLSACGGKQSETDDDAATGGETQTDDAPDGNADPYDAVRTYWSED